MILNSVLQLGGDNTITGGPAVGFEAAGTSTVYISDGTTTVTSDDCSLDIELNGVFVSAGVLNASGSCLNVARGQVQIERGVINTETATVTGSLVLDSRSEGNPVALTHSSRVIVFSGGSIYLIAREGGSATMDATTDGAYLSVTGNANASFLLLDGGEGSQIKTTGDVNILDGYMIASAQEAAGFGGRIELGTSEDILLSEGSRVVLTGVRENDSIPHLGFGRSLLRVASHMVLGNAAAIGSDSSLFVQRNSEIRSFGVDLSSGGGVTCDADGYAFSFVDNVFTDHCL